MLLSLLKIKQGNLKQDILKKHNNFKDRTGEKYITNQGYEIEIIEYHGARNITIQFNDERKTIKQNADFKEIELGKIANPFHPTKYGIAYMGQGEYSSKDEFGNKTKAHNCWSKVLQRCYDKDWKLKNTTYKNCTLSQGWLNFQVFAKWFYDKYETEYMQDWEVDKDLLFKGNKIYSPENCTLLPQQINSIFKGSSLRGKYPIGVSKEGNKYKACVKHAGKLNYLGMFFTPEEAFEKVKIAKEIYIKEVAEEWKDKIEPRAYKAMYNYVVEITD